MKQDLSRGGIARSLLVWGFSHAVVDAACAAAVLAALIDQGAPPSQASFWVLVYVAVAFGLQPSMGRVSDRMRNPLRTAQAGCVLVGASTVFVGISTLSTVLLAGLGNALFHVGGGAISLNLTPNRATAPGLFVAPGAIGLAAGSLVGKLGLFAAWPFQALLLLCIAAPALLGKPQMDYNRRRATDDLAFLFVVTGMLLVTVTCRSLIGLGIDLPWKSDFGLLAILVLAIAGGKAAGGLIGDRYGWMRVALPALVLSAPLIAFGGDTPWLAIPGAFLFNMTMAVTLVSIALLFPGRPGFGFGLPCIALFVGAIPPALTSRPMLDESWSILVVILFSAGTLFGGLKGVEILRSGRGRTTHQQSIAAGDVRPEVGA